MQQVVHTHFYLPQESSMTAERRQLHPRKRPRQTRSELTRQRILEAAARVFADYGYAAGTTNRIAEWADISIGSLYQYYPNKDAILLDLVTRHLDAIVTAARPSSNGPRDSIEGIVRAMVRSAIDGHRDDPELLRVLIEQAPRSRELAEWITEQEQAWVTDLQELLAENPEVCVEDTHVAAQLVIATIEFVVHPLMAAPHPIDIPSFENELVAMLTRYLTAGSLKRDARDAETR
jgi:AcrR family transcriptional regulator